MTWRPTEPQGETFVPTGARYIRENFQQIENVLGADLLNNGTRFEIFPSGTKIWFYQDTAPDGWTIVADASDCLIACKTGNASAGDVTATYNVGGALYGTWQQTDHTLSIDQMPSHSHTYQRYPYEFYQNTNDSFAAKYAGYERYFGNVNTSDAGGNQGHNHGNFWRPLAAVGIICQKT